jgi:hypothetical protein
MTFCFARSTSPIKPTLYYNGEKINVKSTLHQIMPDFFNNKNSAKIKAVKENL